MGDPRFGSVSCYKNHYPRSREHFLLPSPRRHTHPFGGLRLREPANSQYRATGAATRTTFKRGNIRPWLRTARFRHQRPGTNRSADRHDGRGPHGDESVTAATDLNNPNPDLSERFGSLLTPTSINIIVPPQYLYGADVVPKSLCNSLDSGHALGRAVGFSPAKAH